MRPYDAKTFEDQFSLQSDNHPQDSTVWSILLSGADRISLHAPADGQRGAWVEIPRDQFNAIVDWYMKDQAASNDGSDA